MELTTGRRARRLWGGPGFALAEPGEAGRQRLWGARMLLLAAALASAGCGRVRTLQGRVRAVEDERAREVLRNALWAHGSIYAWAERDAIGAEAVFTEHAPEGDRSRREAWRLDVAAGRLRIDSPGGAIETDGRACAAWTAGRPVTDLVARAEACGYGRAVRDLVAMPFSLLAAGRRIEYAGQEVGPGEARAWDLLRVTYDPDEGRDACDGMVVYVRRGQDQVDAVSMRCADLPWAGAWRVEMDEWRRIEGGPAGGARGPVLAHRWRFYRADAQGRREGPLRYTVRIERVEVIR